MNRAQINAQLNELAIRAAVVGQRTESAMKEFNAHVLNNDGVQAQNVRERLHVLLDETLDVTSSSMTLTRALILAKD